jgi:hypothetical protein
VLVDFTDLSLYYECLRSIPSQTTRRAVLTIWSGIVFLAVFASCFLAPAADAPAGKAQIQAGNLRIEFDHRLRSRLVARFDKRETVLGPFSASETLTTAGKVWTDFTLTWDWSAHQESRGHRL